MKFEKGNKIAKGKGRPIGSQSKDVKDIRLAYQNLIEKNLDNLTKWLEEVASVNPAKAIELMNGLSEYVLPKLARTETNLKMTVEENKKQINDLFPFDDETENK